MRADAAAAEDYSRSMEQLLGAVSAQIVARSEQAFELGARLIDFKQPEEIKQLLDLSLPTSPASLDHVLDLFQKTIDLSPNTMNPMFMDKLYAGTTPVGIAAELVAAALNINTHVYKTSPVATMMELACLEEMRRLIGYPVEQGCGMLSPGGSMSNLIAMNTARNHMFPAVKREGLRNVPQLAVFTSAQSHYSIEKAAMVLGIGLDNVFRVDCTLNGQMLVEDLESKIQLAASKGMHPFFVAATSGTTVMCGFDPLRGIAAVAKRHKMWMHVDASWGGPLVLSPKHRHLLDGVELSDSFTINPHKMLGVPLQCSCVVLSHPSHVMAAANATVAHYLFHGNDHDLGRLGIGCGRRGDGVKWFLSWKWEGTSGWQRRVERAMSNAEALRAMVRAHPRLELLIPGDDDGCREMGVNVCFWYVRRDMEQEAGGRAKWRQRLFRPVAAAAADTTNGKAAVGELPPSFSDRVADSTQQIQTTIHHHGRMMIDYAPLSSPFVLPAFFRIPLNAPTVTEDHLRTLVQEIVQVGDELFP
ncbi:Glutamate decarboxylase 2 [Sorochytrium milnesiophthora]